MFHVMTHATDSNGTRKSRNFTDLADYIEAMTVISAALAGQYCALRRPPSQVSDNTVG
jgi:hypothetical protein